MPQNKVFLLDAMALIYRSHFAFSKNPRINSKGMDTGAILGFTNTLVDILNREEPTHIGVAFDTNEPTFRHVEYAEYKANREAQPDEIRIAVPLIKELIQAFNIPVLELDGYEADDVIGTIAKKCGKSPDTKVYMMTSDKDYGQLVEDTIFLYKPSFMGNAIEVLGPEEVKKKWDIEHVDQVVDMLGLQGDAVDNIPGIPGIGPKTASKLLKLYGSVEGLLQNTDKLKGKQKEKVEEFAEQGLLSKKLARIDINVPIDCILDQLIYKGPDKEKLGVVFDELEFKTLKKRIIGESVNNPAKTASDTGGQLSLGFESKGTTAIIPEAFQQSSEVETIEAVPHSYFLISDPEEFNELAEDLKTRSAYAFDTETTGLDTQKSDLLGVSFSFEKGLAYYVDFDQEDESIRKALLSELTVLLADEHAVKIGHNLKYDLAILYNLGIEVKGPLFDTMLAHYLLQPDQRHKMDTLSESYLNYRPVPIEELIGKKGKGQLNMQEVGKQELKEYAAEDADVTFQLYGLLKKELEGTALEKVFYEMEIPLIPVLMEMEQLGVRVDPDALAEISQILQKDLVEFEQQIYELAGTEFNIGSPKQLGEILFEKLKLVEKPKKTRTGQYATGEEILSQLAPSHSIAQLILDYRQVSKLKNTYVDALPELIGADDRIHTSYNQAVAATGRLSSANPNLQNIPIRTSRGREIRKAFVAGADSFELMAADYSQIELRIMADFSKDPTMLDAFKSGRDIHTATAAKIFKVDLDEVDAEMRRKAKTANFGIIYGVSAHGLSQRLNIPRGEAADLIEQYFIEFSSIKAYMDEIINKAREKGYVETIYGRRRYLSNINSRNFTQRSMDERNAINAPIQGTAADIIKLAMIKVHDWFKTQGLKSRMIMQIHDELVFEVEKSEKDLVKSQVEKLMIKASDLEVPMEVESGFGFNWLEAH